MKNISLCPLRLLLALTLFISGSFNPPPEQLDTKSTDLSCMKLRLHYRIHSRLCRVLTPSSSLGFVCGLTRNTTCLRPSDPTTSCIHTSTSHSTPSSSIRKTPSLMTSANATLNPSTSTLDTTTSKWDGPDHIAANPNFPAQELAILEHWKRIDAFNTSMKLAEGREPFSFYDGPPFATGLPHYGHLLAGTIKDVVCRWASLSGRYVERRFGWDTHGLPVEYEVDKTLGIKGPADVEAMGIAAYNAKCRSIVMTYAKEWESTVTRMGRWVDWNNGYKTLDTSFMETVWWVFSELFAKGQVYRGFRIMPYSTGCCTPLSNFEANQNYKDTIDPSVVVSFPLVGEAEEAEGVCLLAWTTTPWTLPSNLGLCVHPDFEYIKIRDNETDAVWILLESRLSMLYKDPQAPVTAKSPAKFTILERMTGASLKGKQYKPIFDYFVQSMQEKCFRILTDTYVTSDSGTGIVHQAPAFGEDDFRVCVAHGLVSGENDLPCPVDAQGCFTPQVSDYAGMYVKDADKPIQKDLKAKGRLIRQSQFSHNYPFCYRSDTPLIYKAVPGWFVRVSNINEKLMKNNTNTYWVPSFVQEKRFQNWLEGARDWNISRNRYWGTPIPLWVSDDMEEVVAIGFVQQLKDLSGVAEITDLHRDSIDHITIPSKMGKGTLRRVSEVFDCWFESGSMPYAQQHYPFENKAKFESTFPADFIAEGIDQTRGWFYTLMVLSTHLFDCPPWKNVIVNGLVLAADGKKMSKRLKNYPDPNLIMETYGADVLRLYLINSPAVRAENLRFREEGVKDLISKVFLPWYNSYRFFFSQLALMRKEHGLFFSYQSVMDLESCNVMDRWILASTQTLISHVKHEMGQYHLYAVTPRILKLIDELTNWYIRFNRRRLKGENGPEEALAALNVLFEVLLTLTKLMASFTPFIAESMYLNLRKCLPADAVDNMDSVHFLLIPEPKREYFNEATERAVSRMQSVIELGRYIREQKGIYMKTPLKEMIIIHPDPEFQRDISSLESYIMEELNVRRVTLTGAEETYGVQYKLVPDFKALAAKFKAQVNVIRKELLTLSQPTIKAFLDSGVLNLCGCQLTLEEVKVTRFFADDSPYQAHFNEDVLVILDTVLDTSLIQEGVAREIINRVQRLRKKALLNPTDDVEYVYAVMASDAATPATVFAEQREFLLKGLKQEMKEGQVPADREVIIQEEQEVNNLRFVLSLLKL